MESVNCNIARGSRSPQCRPLRAHSETRQVYLQMKMSALHNQLQKVPVSKGHAMRGLMCWPILSPIMSCLLRDAMVNSCSLKYKTRSQDEAPIQLGHFGGSLMMKTFYNETVNNVIVRMSNLAIIIHDTFESRNRGLL